VDGFLRGYFTVLACNWQFDQDKIQLGLRGLGHVQRLEHQQEKIPGKAW
jgi:hypothetical protein